METQMKTQIKPTNETSDKTVNVLRVANLFMYTSFLAFLITVVLAYMFEGQFALMTVAVLHVAQLILAGFFKVAYVVRLVSQKQLGLRVA
jgi:hypothetical protein